MKTGTTNEYRDVWVVGYTPNIAVVTWGGNNDNSPIVKKIAGFVLAPMWREFMDNALTIVPFENFIPPTPEENSALLKPVLRGFWQGQESSPSIHSILHWVSKNDPRSSIPSNPQSDPQYTNWEYGVMQWAQKNSPQLIQSGNSASQSTENTLIISSPVNGREYTRGEVVDVSIHTKASVIITSVQYYLNGVFMGSSNKSPFSLSIVPDTSGLKNLKVIVQTASHGIYEASSLFTVK